jgi:hypothetical protein
MCGVTSGVLDSKASNHEVDVSSADPGSGSSVSGVSASVGARDVDLKRTEHDANAAEGRRLELPLGAVGEARREGRKGNWENCYRSATRHRAKERPACRHGSRGDVWLRNCLERGLTTADRSMETVVTS